MDSKELASALLDELLARLQPATPEGDGLGWCYPESTVTYVYGSRADDGSPWYQGTKDDAGNFRQRGTDQSVKGIIKALYPFEQRSEKYGSSWKVRLVLDCGSAGTFSLQCGTQSVAGHNLIHALSGLDASEVSRPITVTPRASEQDAKVLFLEVSADGRQLPSAWDKAEAASKGFWAAKLSTALGTIRSVLGEGAVTAPTRAEVAPTPPPEPEPTDNPPF